MIKRTICFSSGAYLSLKDKQLVIELAEDITKTKKTVPIEDIGVVVLDNPQITITQGAMVSLLENNVAIITCDQRHHPLGLNLCLDGNDIQSERYREQIQATEALKKNLWQQTIIAKIQNQANVLKELGIDTKKMVFWARKVKSGDSENHEARAAAYYWQNLLEQDNAFKRERYGEYPNNFFNYSYSILRAIAARSLVASGLLPTLGIFHKNRYNAYCLADDIMEPYRPYADRVVLETIKKYPEIQEMTKEIKSSLLSLPVVDVKMKNATRPLQIAMGETTASLYQCFSGERRLIKYPILGG
ncbi:MAG: type II CRISPR-associated endonuclease Cas1 [Bacteroidales bacterium]